MYLLLTLNVLHTVFWCFYYWLWTGNVCLEVFLTISDFIYLQWTVTILLLMELFHFWTWPISSMIPIPLSGEPLSGHVVYWNCLMSRDALAWNIISTIFNKKPKNKTKIITTMTRPKTKTRQKTQNKKNQTKTKQTQHWILHVLEVKHYYFLTKGKTQKRKSFLRHLYNKSLAGHGYTIHLGYFILKGLCHWSTSSHPFKPLVPNPPFL